MAEHRLGRDPVRAQPFEHRYLQRKERRLCNFRTIEEVRRFRRQQGVFHRPAAEPAKRGIDPLDAFGNEWIGEQILPHAAPLRAVPGKYHGQSNRRCASMPFGEERGRIAHYKRLELRSDLIAGLAKGSEAMPVVGPLSGCGATQGREGGRHRRTQQFGVAQGETLQSFRIMSRDRKQLDLLAFRLRALRGRGGKRRIRLSDDDMGVGAAEPE